MTDEKLRILHLEDSALDGELVSQILTDGGIDCEIVRRDSRSDYIHELEAGKVDLIMADCSMPDFSGMRALELARQYAPETPFIFVSGTIGEETAIESLRNGATDYVLKNRLSRLVPAVRRALSEVSERMKNVEMECQLRQAQRLDAVGTLAGGIAHDFNNILTIIKGHVALLQTERNQPQRVEEVGAIIDRAAQRGSELVKQLLAFARKSDGSFKPTDLNQRIEEMTGMLREAFPRNITFELNLGKDLPEILADPGQLDRVLINLSTNARDAMPEGGRLTFTTHLVAAKDVPGKNSDISISEYFCLRISDTGTGMTDATRQHIFEPFFTTKPGGKGTGLGMPVVYGLMQSHHGCIDIWSELGKGTVISLFFPVPIQADQKIREKPLQIKESVGGSEMILVVDDEADVCHFLELILKTQGYQVLTAKDAEEAQKIFRDHRTEINLVFSDVGLPGLDGLGLCVVLKEMKPEVLTILASGYGDAELKSRMAALGINGFLAKPYEMPHLLEIIRTAFDKAAAS